MCSKKDYTTIQCKNCSIDISVCKYELTRKNPHKGLCRVCAMEKKSKDIKAKTSRDDIYLKKQLRNIKARCSGKYDKYASYTKKGIQLCVEWKRNPQVFIDWAKANGWKRNLTIDRINNDGNYEPNNCRWISNEQNVLESEVSRKSRGVSKYIGVWFRKDTKKWSVDVRVDKKKVNLGCFNNEEDAMMAREKYIIENKIPYLKRNT